jgi:lipopolysaccharide exporter
MEDRALKGVPWTLLTFGAGKVITLITTVALARLLEPKDFGIMALALLAYGFLGILRDLGLGAAVILRQDYDDVALGTVLTLMLLTSIAVTAFVAATAPIAAWALDEPRLNSILPALASTNVFALFGAFYDSLLQRELEFQKRFAGQMAQSIGFLVAGVGGALAGLGVWSLVLAQLVSMIAYAGVTYAVSPRHIPPRFDRGHARDAFSTSSGFLVQGGLAWAIHNVDYLVVGRVLGATSLGYYSMAYRLAELPYYGIADPIAKVTFPAFARMRMRGEEVASTFLGSLRIVALTTCLIGVLLSAAAEPFTAVVFGDQWLPMVGVLAVLGIWAAVKPVEATLGWLVNSFGQAAMLARASAILLVPMLVALVLLADEGLTMVGLIVLAHGLASGVASSIISARRADMPIAMQLGVLWPIVAAGTVTWAVARLAADQLADTGDVAALAGSVAAGTAVFVVAVTLLAPTTPRFVTRQARRMLRGAPEASAGTP